jgi:hypothetical protein
VTPSASIAAYPKSRPAFANWLRLGTESKPIGAGLPRRGAMHAGGSTNMNDGAGKNRHVFAKKGVVAEAFCSEDSIVWV